MRSNEFMSALPETVQRQLGAEIHLRRGRLWPWGVQFYVDDPRFHYEVSRVPPKLGDRLELGLHFESKNPAENRWLLAGFDMRMAEILASLGEGVMAEPWDRGWAKVYITTPLEPYSEAFLNVISDRMAGFVRVLHPIYLLVNQVTKVT
jgi:hypothetical protein